MIVEIILYNLLILCILTCIGFFPADLLERKINHEGLFPTLFVSLIFGYFIAESLVAIWFTNGITMQWLNLIPILCLFFMPDVPKTKLKPPQDYKYLILPVFLFLFSCWYFLRSYSYDFQHFDRYPFIDIISYACNSLSMKLSGAETSVSAGAIFFPDQFRLALYHFSELWGVVGITKLLPVTETYAICFILPVLFFTIIGFGIYSIADELKISSIFLAILGVSLCFSNAKLLVFQDVFLYSLIDLGGLKISLLFPLVLFFWILRKSHFLVFNFLLFMPQVNALYFILVAVLSILYLIFLIRNKNLVIPKYLLGGYGCFVLIFVSIFFSQNFSQGSIPFKEFSVLSFIFNSFTYFREALFNLGINYWAAFIIVSGLFFSWRNLLLLIPFISAKVVSRLLQNHSMVDQGYFSILEIIFFLSILILLDRKYKIFNHWFWLAIIVLFCLCSIGAIGYTLTGHMDFEQIFTLFACSIFLVMVLFLFQNQTPNQGLIGRFLPDNLNWIISGFCLLGICFLTFRFQRALSFDVVFYDEISKAMKMDMGKKFSAHYTTKKMYPFPLHVQAGFPLLFEHSTALSTTVSLLQDTSWEKTERAAQVKNFPFYIFSTKDAQYQIDKNIPALQNRFIKHFSLKYIWIDPDYNKANIAIPEEAIERKFVSKLDEQEFWIIKPELL